MDTTAIDSRPGMTRLVGLVALASFVVVLLPIVPIALGLLLIVATTLHWQCPTLRPYLDSILLVPVAVPAKRRTHLTYLAVAGSLLIVVGAAGATATRSWRGEWKQRAKQRASTDTSVITLIERAQDRLAAGNIEGAELTLLDARAMSSLEPWRTGDIEELLRSIRYARDEEMIFDTLLRLSNEELEGLRAGTLVPEALDLGEPALTGCAVRTALELLEEVDRARGEGRG